MSPMSKDETAGGCSLVNSCKVVILNIIVHRRCFLCFIWIAIVSCLEVWYLWYLCGYPGGLCSIGYPKHVIKSFMAKNMRQFHVLPKFGTKDAPSIYVCHGSVLFLPGLKSKYNLLSNNVFPLWNPAFITLSTSFSPLPTRMYCLRLRKSNVIYRFVCHCDTRHVGYTSQRLQDRIKHVPNLYVLALLFRNAYFCASVQIFYPD